MTEEPGTDKKEQYTVGMHIETQVKHKDTKDITWISATIIKKHNVQEKNLTVYDLKIHLHSIYSCPQVLQNVKEQRLRKKVYKKGEIVETKIRYNIDNEHWIPAVVTQVYEDTDTVDLTVIAHKLFRVMKYATQVPYEFVQPFQFHPSLFKQYQKLVNAVGNEGAIGIVTGDKTEFGVRKDKTLELKNLSKILDNEKQKKAKK